MTRDCSGLVSPRRWRAARRRRADDRRALRSEFELDRPRGLAALRSLALNVAELEGERIRSHSAHAQVEPRRPT